MLDFVNGETSKIDDVLTEHGGLLHVLPPTTHLNFFFMDKKGTVGEVGWVAHKILVSAQGPLVLVLRLRVWGQGLTILPDCEEELCEPG